MYRSAEASAAAKTELALVWLVYGAGAATILVLTAEPTLVPVALALVAAVVAAVRLPESVLVLFLVVGPLRATELGARLTSVAPADLTALAGLALAIAVGSSLWKHRAEPFAIPWPAFLFLLLVVLAMVGAFYSRDPEGGFEKALRFETFSALAFFAPLAIVRTRSSLYRLLALFVGVGIAVALSAEQAERSAAVLVLPGADNQIQVGLLLGLAVVSIVGYLWPASNGWLRLVWVAPLALTLMTLFSSGGRSALVGTFVACVLGTVWLLRSDHRNRIAAFALVGVLAALLPAAWITTEPAAKDRYLVTIAELRGGAGLDAGDAERSELADAAVRTFESHPLGTGTAGYTALTGYEYPHNIVLELASELGLLGVVALVGLLVGIAVRSLNAARSPALRTEVIGAASLLVLPLTMSFASFDLNGNRVLWFACGLALASTSLREASA